MIDRRHARAHGRFDAIGAVGVCCHLEPVPTRLLDDRAHLLIR